MNQKIQVMAALLNKQAAERRLALRLNDWIEEITTHYRVGDTVVGQDSVSVLTNILKRFYNRTAKMMLRFDVREYKARQNAKLKERIARQISSKLGQLYADRVVSSTRSITQTANEIIRSMSRNAIQEKLGELEARRALVNYLKNHRATVSITESQWVVETTRMEVVKSVDRTLKIFANEVAELLESGMLKDAGKTAAEGLALGDMPLSSRQSDLLNVVLDNTKKTVDPIADRENIMTIRQAAENMGKELKRWETVGDGRVRESHVKANGQTVKIDEPFELDGGMVRYPGDGALGADLSELVNCRCVAVYE